MSLSHYVEIWGIGIVSESNELGELSVRFGVCFVEAYCCGIKLGVKSRGLSFCD